MVSSVPRKAESRASSALCGVLGAADEAHRGHAVAVAVERRLAGGDERRVVGEPEVVVGAEVQHPPAGLGVDRPGLRRGDDPLVLVEPLAADRAQLGGEPLDQAAGHALRSSVADRPRERPPGDRANPMPKPVSTATSPGTGSRPYDAVFRLHPRAWAPARCPTLQKEARRLSRPARAPRPGSRRPLTRAATVAPLPRARVDAGFGTATPEVRATSCSVGATRRRSEALDNSLKSERSIQQYQRLAKMCACARAHRLPQSAFVAARYRSASASDG